MTDPRAARRRGSASRPGGTRATGARSLRGLASQRRDRPRARWLLEPNTRKIGESGEPASRGSTPSRFQVAPRPGPIAAMDSTAPPFAGIDDEPRQHRRRTRSSARRETRTDFAPPPCPGEDLRLAGRERTRREDDVALRSVRRSRRKTTLGPVGRKLRSGPRQRVENTSRTGATSGTRWGAGRELPATPPARNGPAVRSERPRSRLPRSRAGEPAAPLLRRGPGRGLPANPTASPARFARRRRRGIAGRGRVGRQRRRTFRTLPGSLRQRAPVRIGLEDRRERVGDGLALEGARPVSIS